jgi:multiple sugar transport system ATP-binding protein
MAEVVLSGVSKRFKDVEAVSDLSLTIGDGEFVVLLGPTGVGKTTTLRLIAGLERADSGRITIDGRDVTQAEPAARDTTFVFQQYSLYPHLTVYDNLAFPLRSPLRRLPEAEIKARVGQVAAMLRIDDKLQNAATRLSGGQMQRVAIGRALVRRPNIYLMDEPLSSLDAKLRAELRLELKRIQQELGATILYVTHDQIEAMTMATRIGVMEAGKLVQIGTPREIYEDPASIYVATRLGQPSVNLMPRALVGGMPMPGEAITVGARTEHVRLTRSEGRTGEGVAGSIKRIEHLGDQNHLHISLGGTDIVTLADPDSGLSVGDTVGIEFAKPLFFGADGQRIRG